LCNVYTLVLYYYNLYSKSGTKRNPIILCRVQPSVTVQRKGQLQLQRYKIKLSKLLVSWRLGVIIKDFWKSSKTFELNMKLKLYTYKIYHLQYTHSTQKTTEVIVIVAVNISSTIKGVLTPPANPGNPVTPPSLQLYATAYVSGRT